MRGNKNGGCRGVQCTKYVQWGIEWVLNGISVRC
jgi:hypothetical protein